MHRRQNCQENNNVVQGRLPLFCHVDAERRALLYEFRGPKKLNRALTWAGDLTFSAFLTLMLYKFSMNRNDFFQTPILNNYFRTGLFAYATGFKNGRFGSNNAQVQMCIVAAFAII